MDSGVICGGVWGDGEGRWLVASTVCYDCSWGCVRKAGEEGLSVISMWKAVDTRGVDETPAPLAGAERGSRGPNLVEKHIPRSRENERNSFAIKPQKQTKPSSFFLFHLRQSPAKSYRSDMKGDY